VAAKTEVEHDYGTHKNGKPRRVPIRLLGAAETLIYWVVIFVPIIWLAREPLRSWLTQQILEGNLGWLSNINLDGGLWFDRALMLTMFGWLPFGLLGNALIRLTNKFILRTDWRRPPKIRRGFAGQKLDKHVPKGYQPPTATLAAPVREPVKRSPKRTKGYVPPVDVPSAGRFDPSGGKSKK
jgi:hypothetical protein